MRTLADLRQYVADHLHLDDLPARMVDTWIRHGYRQIQNATAWPWHRRDQVMTVAATGDVLKQTELFDTRRVISVADPQAGVLTELPFQQALREFYAGRQQTGTPAFYTVVSDADSLERPAVKLRLWPPQSEDRANVLVSSLAAVRDWPTPTSRDDEQPPLPEPFHELLELWCLNEAYLREGNREAATPHYTTFGRQLEALKGQFVSVGAGNVRLNQGLHEALQDSLTGY